MDDNDEVQLEKLESYISRSKWILLGAISITIGFYFWHFHGRFEAQDKWGQFGDFVGGVLNPLISFGAFYWLSTSVLMQKQELLANRKAMYAAHAAAQQQADTALLTAYMQAEIIEISAITAKLSHLRALQLHLLEVQATKGNSG